MTQDAIVTKILPNEMAEVAVARTTACGGNCGSCEACIFQSELKTVARNRIGARVGQKVVIASKSSTIFGAALLVYVMPLLFFIAAYAAAYLLGAREGLCIAVSFIGLLVGAAVMVMSQRMKREKEPITFDIVS
ncbi:MAG: SoxR reducing system RseC family protein [Oscillospiraceae bacterium]|nr:SoxR reducing system RseC family protein [Oscillospiraceae bacterium]